MRVDGEGWVSGGTGKGGVELDACFTEAIAKQVLGKWS